MGLVSARAGRVTHLRVLVRTVGRYVRTRWIWKRGDRRRWPEIEAIQNPGTSQPASVFHMTKKMIVFVRMANSTKPWRSGGQDCFHGRAGGAVAVFGALW